MLSPQHAHVIVWVQLAVFPQAAPAVVACGASVPVNVLWSLGDGVIPATEPDPHAPGMTSHVTETEHVQVQASLINVAAPKHAQVSLSQFSGQLTSSQLSRMLQVAAPQSSVQSAGQVITGGGGSPPG